MENDFILEFTDCSYGQWKWGVFKWFSSSLKTRDVLQKIFPSPLDTASTPITTFPPPPNF